MTNSKQASQSKQVNVLYCIQYNRIILCKIRAQHLQVCA